VDSSDSRQDLAVISFENENEHLISIRGGTYLAQRSKVHGMTHLFENSGRRCEQV
jgi:hypothetical protein